MENGDRTSPQKSKRLSTSPVRLLMESFGCCRPPNTYCRGRKQARRIYPADQLTALQGAKADQAHSGALPLPSIWTQGPKKGRGIPPNASDTSGVSRDICVKPFLFPSRAVDTRLALRPPSCSPGAPWELDDKPARWRMPLRATDDGESSPIKQ